jgi:hypothetical protein
MMMNDAKRNWGWYASADQENYSCGPETSRDAIIQAATDDEIGLCDLLKPQVFHIVEAWQGDVMLADHFDADAWIEELNDNLSDVGHPDGEPMIDLTAVALSSLDRAVREAVGKWQSDNNLRFRQWVFGGTRNEETITVPVASREAIK